MRVGLDLRDTPADQLCPAAVQADELGLWAVLFDGDAATVSTVAAELATRTEHIHLAACYDVDQLHTLTIAEEISILDHLSRRRIFPILSGAEDRCEEVAQLLLGRTVRAMTLAPPPAQSMLRVHGLGPALPCAALSGDLQLDRETIDASRAAGTTHLFVSWPGPLLTLARHLVSRAATADFPQIVADHADTIAAPSESDR